MNLIDTEIIPEEKTVPDKDFDKPYDDFEEDMIFYYPPSFDILWDSSVR